MTAKAFVPDSFDPPTSLATDRLRLEPLGPQHNQADHAAWMSSIDHIRSRAGRSELDAPLADAVARWLATDWPWKRVDRCGR